MPGLNCVDLQRTAAFLCDDVNFVGTGEGEFANSRAEMTAYIGRDIEEITEPFNVKMEDVCRQQICGKCMQSYHGYDTDK